MHFLRAALRPLRRPGFSLVVVTVMALSVGLATAAFSLTYAVFLRPLPFRDADRLALYCCTFPEQGDGWRDAPGSPAAMRDYQHSARFAEQVALFYDQHNLTLTDDAPGAAAERVPVTFVAGNYFPLLGAAPAIGRSFTAEECRPGAAQAVVVASHVFWRNHLGARADAVGAVIRLNGRLFTVIGVMPEDFRDLSNENGPPQLWLPLPQAAPYLGADFWSAYSLQTFRAAVLRPAGVSAGAAQAEADVIARHLAQAQPATHHGRGIRLMPVREFFFLNARPAVLVLFVGALLVLVIAAVNLANLFLVDGLRRKPELALRAALGADGPRLARTVLGQALGPLLLGGAAGLGLASGLVALFNRASALALPDFARVQMSPAVLVAATALIAGVAVVAGLLPARRAGQVDLRTALSAARAGDAGSTRTRHLLIAAEVAVATALLVATGLTLKSLRQIMRSEHGYNPHRLLSFQVQLDRARWPTRDQRVGLARALNAALQGGPGVEAATLWGPSMLGHAGWVYTVTPGRSDPVDPRAGFEVQHLHTVPGGLAALGIPLRRGRDFSAGNLPENPAEVIVDEDLARHLWPGQDPLGQTLWLAHDPGRPALVIGVVAPVRNRGRTFDDRTNTGDLYASFYQVPNDHVCVLLRHPAGQAGAVLAWARAQIARLDPTLAIFDVDEMDDRLAQQERTPEFTATLLGAYASISLLLTIVGIYGVLAFGATQRTREFGIRIAIGATRRQVLQLVMGEGARWIGAGLAAGLTLAVLTAPVLSDVLVNVAPQDPGVLAAAAGLIAATGLAATALPALRAARVDPLVTLRAE